MRHSFKLFVPQIKPRVLENAQNLFPERQLYHSNTTCKAGLPCTDAGMHTCREVAFKGMFV